MILFNYSGHGLCSVVIAGSERRAKRRRAQHSAVEQARRPQIGRVLMLPSDERAGVYFRNRLARNRPLRCRSNGIFGGEILRERLASREFRILKRAARGGIGDFRVSCDQSRRRDIPFLCRYSNQKIARGCRYAPQLRGNRRRRPAAKRARIKRRQRGIRRHHPDAFEWHSQFIGDGLR